LLSLFDTFCIPVPVLLYGLEVLSLAKSAKSTLEFCLFYRSFYKLLKVNDKGNIDICKYYSGCLPVICRLDIRKLIVFSGLHGMKDSLKDKLFELATSDEYRMLMHFYDILPCDRSYSFKHKMVKMAKDELEH